jgi:hypothetical protein
MATLYTLLFGKSKKRMTPIMIDKLSKVENYKRQREKTKGSDAARGWHEIVPAEAGAVPWRQRSATVGGNRCETVLRIGHGLPGWIGKNGFQVHT